MALSTIPNNMQAAMTTTEMPAGTTIQTVQAVKTDVYSSASTSFVTTGLEVTITPLFANSKILITGLINVSGNGHYNLRLVRNAGIDIMMGDSSGSTTSATYHNYRSTDYNMGYAADGVPMNYLDSPATTSATTYKIFAANPHSSSYNVTLNSQYSNSSSNWAGRTASSLTAQEIKQ